jgi:hypothetical protein
MKVITSIYLNCRPDLRDEWLTGTEVDDVSDAQVSHIIESFTLASQSFILIISGPRAGTATSGQVLYVFVVSCGDK